MAPYDVPILKWKSQRVRVMVKTSLEAGQVKVNLSMFEIPWACAHLRVRRNITVLTACHTFHITREVSVLYNEPGVHLRRKPGA